MVEYVLLGDVAIQGRIRQVSLGVTVVNQNIVMLFPREKVAARGARGASSWG